MSRFQTRKEPTEEELKFMKDNYLEVPIKEIARKFGKTFGWVTRQFKIHNLVIPDEIKKQRRMMHCFKKGFQPKNTGKKLDEYLTSEQIEKIKLTQFKKGQIPHNSLPVGSQVNRQYKSGKVYVKLKIEGERTLKYKHIHIYEENFGKVPKGCCVIFKDRNELNFDPNNLMAISRGALMLWNSRRTDIPIELLEDYARISKLNNLIKNKQK